MSLHIKYTAAAVCASLILTAPGVPCYQALASVAAVSSAGRGAAVSGAAGASVGAVPHGLAGQLLNPVQVDIQGSLSTVANLSVQPAANIPIPTTIPSPTLKAAHQPQAKPLIKERLPQKLGRIQKQFPKDKKNKSGIRSRLFFDGGHLLKRGGASAVAGKASITASSLNPAFTGTPVNKPALPAPRRSRAKSSWLVPAADAALLTAAVILWQADLLPVSLGLSAALFMLGEVGGGAPDPRDKVFRGQELSGPTEIWINLDSELSPQQRGAFVRRHGLSAEAEREWIMNHRLRIVAGSVADAGSIVRSVIEDERVDSIAVHQEIEELIQGAAPAAPPARSAYRAGASDFNDGSPAGDIWIYFREGTNRAAIETMLGDSYRADFHMSEPTPRVVVHAGGSADDAYRLGARMITNPNVSEVRAHIGVAWRLRTDTRAEILADRRLEARQVRARFLWAADPEGARAVFFGAPWQSSSPETLDDDTVVVTATLNSDADMARALQDLAAVDSIDRIYANPDEVPTIEGPAPQQNTVLDKLTSEGYEGSDPLLLKVRLYEEVAARQIGEIVARSLDDRYRRWEFDYVDDRRNSRGSEFTVFLTNLHDDAAMAEGIMLLAAEQEVAEIGVSPEYHEAARGEAPKAPTTPGKFSTADHGSVDPFFFRFRIAEHLNQAHAHGLMERSFKDLFAGWKVEDENDGPGVLVSVNIKHATGAETFIAGLLNLEREKGVSEIIVKADILDLVRHARPAQPAPAPSGALSKIQGDPRHYYGIGGGIPDGREVKVYLRPRPGGPSADALVDQLGIEYGSMGHNGNAPEEDGTVEVKIDGTTFSDLDEFARQVIRAAGIEGVERIVVSPEVFVEILRLEGQPTEAPAGASLLDKFQTNPAAENGPDHLVVAVVRLDEGDTPVEEMAEIKGLTGGTVDGVTVAREGTYNGVHAQYSEVHAGSYLADEEFARKLAALAWNDRVVGIEVRTDKMEAVRPILEKAALAQQHSRRNTSGASPEAKIHARQDMIGVGNFWIHYRPGLTQDELRAIQGPYVTGSARFITLQGKSGPFMKSLIEAPDANAAADLAHRIAAEPDVTAVHLHPDAADLLRSAPANMEPLRAAPPQHDRKIVHGDLAPDFMKVEFNAGTSDSLIDTVLGAHGFGRLNANRNPADVRPGEIGKILALAAEAVVHTITLGAAKFGELAGRNVFRAAPAPTAEEVSPPEEAPHAAETEPEPDPGPLGKAAVDASVFERHELRVMFAPGTSAEQIDAFLNDHILKNAGLYRRPDPLSLSLISREPAASARTMQAAKQNAQVASVLMSQETWADLNSLKDEVFTSETPENDLRAVEEERGLLIRFIEQDSQKIHEFAKKFDLRLAAPDYREKGQHLYEMPESYDPAWLIDAMRVNIENGNWPVAEISPLIENESAPIEKAPPPAARRDAHADWIEFLNTRPLNGGDKTLTSEQVRALSVFLKPVVPPSGVRKHPVIGRMDEMKRATRILTAPRGGITSAMLVGPAGTGKTAVFEGLAQLIEDAEHADAVRVRKTDGSSDYLHIKRLRARWFVELDIDRLLTEEDPVKTLLALIDMIPQLNNPDQREGNKVILLLDEIQKLRDNPQGIRIMNAMKRPIRDGRIAVAGTTTDKEWKQYFDTDEALKSRFELIPVDEPAPEETLEMLRGAKAHFEWKHDTQIDDDALEAAAKLSEQFIKEFNNPRASFDFVIPGAAELARPDNLRSALAFDIREGWRRLTASVNTARQTLIDKGIASSLALPAELYNRVAGLIKEIIEDYEARDAVQDGKGAVTSGVVKRRISEMTGIHAGQLTMGEEDTQRYVDMEQTMAEDVVNQDRALEALGRAIRRNKAGLGDPNKPMGKFLFVGPTGTGKTHIVKQLAKFLFEDEEAYIRFDMTEFMEQHSVARLIGSPPGYVGYEEAGQLTEAVRKKPYSVVLFDEIEKAHPDVWNIFLQILDDGHLTDGHGRRVDFKNTVIIFTSNIGMDVVDSDGFARRIAEAEEKGDRKMVDELQKAWDEDIATAIKEGIKSRMRPEFVNRLDPDPRSKSKWVLFNRLNRAHARLITKIELRKFTRLLEDRHGTKLEYDKEVIDFISEYGFSPVYGARPLKETIEKFISDTLALWILKEATEGGSDVRGGRIKVSIEDGKPKFTVLPKEEKKVERTALEGLAHRMTEEVMAVIEGLVEDWLGDGQGTPEPTESYFDSILHQLKGDAPSAPAEGTPTAFYPDTPLPMRADAAYTAEHNNPAKRDQAMRKAIKDAVALSPDLLGGEGFLKLFVRHAKARAGAGEKPVSLKLQRADGTVRALVHGDHALTDDERRFLQDHFTGTPPASLRAAQKKADLLGVDSEREFDSALLDLYRRIATTPGARIGFASDSAGTDYWLEIAPPRESIAAAAAPKKLTPHQQRERAKAKKLFLKTVLSKNDDGPAISIAAATGWAELSTPEDLAEVRGWILDKKWAAKDTISGRLTGDWPLLMTMALTMEKHGTAADIKPLETMLRALTSGSHFHQPAKTALTGALTAVLTRAGYEEVLTAYERSKGVVNHEVNQAVLPALGQTGRADDIDKLLSSTGGMDYLPNAEGFAHLVARTDPDRLAAFMAERWPVNSDGKIPKDRQPWDSRTVAERTAVLRIVAAGTDNPERDLEILWRIVGLKHGSDRPTTYAAAEAFGTVAGRLGGAGDLKQRFADFNKTHTMTSSDRDWGKLLALLHTAREVGGADVLPALEEILARSPSGLDYNYEQPYFETPLTWAKVLVRSGLFPAYARTRLQKMLTSRRPMETAAALYAIALARS
ncbi:MAG: ATP-dependent Clp protease ATP-binding subunit [Elusimicrobiota bacterium]